MVSNLPLKLGGASRVRQAERDGVRPVERLGANSPIAGPDAAYDRGCLLDALPATAVDAILPQAATSPDCPLALVEIRRFGGAVARHPVAVSERRAELAS